jgi:hypothetical protein
MKDKEKLLEAATSHFNKLAYEFDKKVADVHTSIGEAGTDAAIKAATCAWRAWASFGHAIAGITDRRTFEVRSSITERLSDYHKRRFLAIRHAGGLPLVEFNADQRKLLAELRESWPKPVQPITDAETESYVSRTGSATRRMLQEG